MDNILELAYARSVLDTLSAGQLRNIAAHALENGLDSHTLRIMSGMPDDEAVCGVVMLATTLQELGMRVPSMREAVMLLAREVAKGITQGSLDPYSGAKRIWDLSLRVPGEHFAELDTFVYGASEWCDRPEDNLLLAEGIIAAARELAQG